MKQGKTIIIGFIAVLTAALMTTIHYRGVYYPRAL